MDNIKNIDIKKLKPDPHQPRKNIVQEQVDEMAISIKNEGIINPIEIDKDYTIITGELRWRGSLAAGLSEVPCRIIDVKNKRRFIRQMHENVHHNTMTAWDTAIGFKKTIELIEEERGGKTKMSRLEQEKELSNIFGIKRDSVAEYLSLLSESKEIQEELKNSRISRTKVTEASHAPEIFREELKAKIIKEPSMTRDGIRVIKSALRRAEMSGEIDKGREILKQNFDGMGTLKVAKLIDKVYPDKGVMLVDKSASAVSNIVNTSVTLMNLLEKNPVSTLMKIDAIQLDKQLRFLVSAIGEYFKVKKSIEQ